MGRAVILGDHPMLRKMVGGCLVWSHCVSNLKPRASPLTSEDIAGVTGLEVGSMAASFCLPPALCIQLGMIHIGQTQDNKSKKNPEAMGTKVVLMSLEFAVRHHIFCILVLMRFSFRSGF